jgi:hypothetical protein
MHIDAATNRVTVYAQSRLLGKVIAPPQVGPGERILRIFLDTSVIFAAVLSEIGRARKLFKLGEAGVLQHIVGSNVLRECEVVVRHKAPTTLPTLAYLLDVQSRTGQVNDRMEHLLDLSTTQEEQVAAELGLVNRVAISKSRHG